MLSSPLSPSIPSAPSAPSLADPSVSYVCCGDFDLDNLVSDATLEPHLDHDKETRIRVSGLDDDNMSDLTDVPSEEEDVIDLIDYDNYPGPFLLDPLPQPEYNDLSRKEKKKKYRKKHTKKARREGRGKQGIRKAENIEKLGKKQRDNACKIPVDIDTTKLRRSAPGYVGVKMEGEPEERPPIEWIQVPRPKDPIAKPVTALYDKKGRVFAVRITPRSHDTNPMDYIAGLTRALNKLRSSHRRSLHTAKSRGEYKNITFGVSYGNGMTKPAVLNEKSNDVALNDWKTDAYVKKLTQHVRNGFYTWAKDLFLYYQNTAIELEKIKPAKPEEKQIKRPYEDLPFMASTINLRPCVVTIPHKDFMNLVNGLCAISVLGRFDWTKGGKLCLEEAGIQLEVAPGDIVLIPSACITHYNTPIGPEETRSSITFYTAGQLFRWVHDNHRRVNELTSEEKEAAKKEGKYIWENGWDRFYNVYNK